MRKKDRFWLFAGDHPSEGLGDYQGSYTSHEKAMEKANNIHCDWWCIVIENEWGDLIETYKGRR